MGSSEQYRQYAADCRRIASKMDEKDRAVLMQIADAWEMRAQAAERRAEKKGDGQG